MPTTLPDTIAPTADTHTIDAPTPTIEPGAPTPPDAPGELSWRPQGGEPKFALAIETDPVGGGKLRLCFSTSRAALHDVSQARGEADGRARSRVLDLLQSSPQFERLTALRPQFRAACEESRKAEAELRRAKERQSALREMVPAPSNLASRLLAAQQQVDQAAEEARTKAAELQAITPLFHEVEASVRSAMPALCIRAHAEAHVAAQAELTELLNEMAAQHRDKLTRIYLLKRAADGLRPQSHEALSRLVIESADDV
jgi:hypothetical protein